MTEKKKKKRGRKPKGKIIQINKINDVNSEEDSIIAHLPIKIEPNNSDSIFIKSETDIKTKTKTKTKNNDKKTIDKLNLKIKKLNHKLEMLRPCKKKILNIYKTNYNNNTKCWWCKYSFDSQPVGLPDNYFNNKFNLIGCFCSFNCAKSYNIDLNDNKYLKRNNLLNYLYYKSYNEEKEIIPAPNWKILKDFGGTITIEQFRDDFLINSTEFIYLDPPLISRKPYIEEINRTSNFINKDKYYSLIEKKKEDIVLKRSKPLKTNVYNLHSMLGLKKK